MLLYINHKCSTLYVWIWKHAILNLNNTYIFALVTKITLQLKMKNYSFYIFISLIDFLFFTECVNQCIVFGQDFEMEITKDLHNLKSPDFKIIFFYMLSPICVCVCAYLLSTLLKNKLDLKLQVRQSQFLFYVDCT